MSKCDKCGESLVCPKCTPLVQHTNCINVRFKGKYNGGLPNHLLIFPSYTRDGDPVSIATIIGDNFFKKAYYTSRSISVEHMAVWIANSDWDYMMSKFDFDKHHKPMFTDLQDKLKEYLSSVVESEPVGP